MSIIPVSFGYIGKDKMLFNQLWITLFIGAFCLAGLYTVAYMLVEIGKYLITLM